MPDPKLLAEALVLLLAQALPSLLAAGEKAAGKAVEEIGKQAGGAVSGKVKDIWDRLRGKVDEKEPAQEAAKDVALAPEDPDALASLRIQLRKILEADPGLAAELAPRIEAAQTEIETTQVYARDQAMVAVNGGVAGQVAVGRDIHGNVLILNTVQGARPPEEILRWFGQEQAPEALKKHTDDYSGTSWSATVFWISAASEFPTASRCGCRCSKCTSRSTRGSRRRRGRPGRDSASPAGSWPRRNRRPWAAVRAPQSRSWSCCRATTG